MSEQRIGPKGLALVKAFESFVAWPYDDLVPSRKGVYPEWTGGPLRGTATIGYGHTDAAKHPLKVRPGIRLTEKQAVEILDVDMDECEADVRRFVKVPLTQGQFDALCSFTFNCGVGSLKNIAARLNRGDYANARQAIGLYTKSKGIELAGLVRRRKAEQALWDDTYTALPTKPVDHPEDVDNESFPPPPDIEPIIKPAPSGFWAALIRFLSSIFRR